ncbi:MAG: hypothetical protein AMJ58_07545 [Gammaproteobacteria bacterium SG8_30]|nr:MAG: hypothetical protein AMJ58_07545 [Gammaproteobacteria bacterium SG8_30]
MTRIPPVFVSHGSPMLALEPATAGPMMRTLARERLPRPEAILVVSAHWETTSPTVSRVARSPIIHDFSGFPRRLYELGYDAPGAPALAERTRSLLDSAGLEPRVSEDRGLDHGAWVPLRYLYPEAALPVTQLSVVPRRGAAWHLDLGRALRPLADEGVLVLGSGGLTHNLGEIHGRAADARPPDWVSGFADWAAARLEAGDADALAAFRELGPHAAQNHPTEEHFLPLLVALGAAGRGATGLRVPGGFTYGVLAMDAFVMAAAASAEGSLQ